MKLAYRTALICGAAPLVAGSALFLLWLATEWEGVAVAGIATIYGGLVLVAVGLAALGRYGWLALRAGDPPRSAAWGKVASALLLLLGNFPLALGIIGGVAAIESRYRIVVRNESALPLSRISLIGGGTGAAIYSLPATATAERTLWFQRDGTLEFEAMLGSARLTHAIDGYVTHGRGGRATIVVGADGRVAVTHPGNSK